MVESIYSEGERVLANWQQDDYWYICTIQEIIETEIHVIYDEGTREILTIENLRKVAIKPGDFIEGRWLGEMNYYPGTVIKVKGENVKIEYKDGKKEWLPMSLTRF